VSEPSERVAPALPARRDTVSDLGRVEGPDQEDQRPLLVVAMPALNEAATVGDVVGRVPRDTWEDLRVMVLVVDDGSSDDTGDLARAAGAQVVRHPKPRGVGAAFHTALRAAVELGAEMLVTIDSDGQFDPADIPRLVEPVRLREADFATASRFLDPALTPVMPWVKRWGNRQMSRLISSLSGLRFQDVSCGMRCYGRKAMLHLNLQGEFTYTQEVFLNLAYKRLRIAEIPVAVRGEREFGKSRVASSITRYAVNTSWIIFRCYRDYHPLRFYGGLALLLSLPGLGLLGFLGVHYLRVGAFTPHKWAGLSGGAFMLAALVCLHLGLMGDMLTRHRIYLEEVLYKLRKGEQRERARGGRDQDEGGAV
jgi:glycosyltransferase involved in cell wall biosynthesis